MNPTEYTNQVQEIGRIARDEARRQKFAAQLASSYNKPQDADKIEAILRLIVNSEGSWRLVDGIRKKITFQVVDDTLYGFVSLLIHEAMDVGDRRDVLLESCEKLQEVSLPEYVSEKLYTMNQYAPHKPTAKERGNSTKPEPANKVDSGFKLDPWCIGRAAEARF